MVCDIFNKNFEDIERGGYWIEVKGCYIHFKTKKNSRNQKTNYSDGASPHLNVQGGAKGGRT